MLKLYRHYLSIQLKGMMQYKASFFLTVIGQFLTSFGLFLTIYFVFARFQEVEGFTFSEVLLTFSVMLMSFTLAEMLVRGFDTFGSMISYGAFDRIMVRPRNEIFQVLASKIELTRCGRVLQAIVTLVYAIPNSSVDWNASKILTLILMIAGGTAVFSGLFIIYASLCFFTIEGLEFMNVFTDGAREHGKYPLSIYGKWVLRFCTCVIPYALFQYYPLLYLLGRAEHDWYRFLPFAAMLFLIPSLLLWKLGLRHYQSAGS